MGSAIRMFGLQVVLLVCLGLGMQSYAFAAMPAPAPAGTVVNMEGSLVAKGGDGQLRALALGSKVFAGDMLFTSKKSYARIRFEDGGVINLRPHVQFKIEAFHFDEKQPKADRSEFTLVKGGLRAISGLIGHRGNPDSYEMKTRAATIGIRGTDFGLQLCHGDCGDIPTPDGVPMEDGLHVDVFLGVVLVKNAEGSLLVHAGEFGFVKAPSTPTAPHPPPVLIPTERGVSVTIPARINVDKVRGKGNSDGDNGAGSGGATPNVCPTS